MKPLVAGQVVTRADVEVRSLPRRVVPNGSPASLQTVLGTTVAVPLSTDEIVSPGLLASRTMSPAELLVGPGHVGIAVETGVRRPNLAVGNTVIVVPSPGAGSPEGATAVEGRVVELQEGFVTVAVPSALATRLAAIIGNGPAVIALKGG